jgi:hypothetical protein
VRGRQAGIDPYPYVSAGSPVNLEQAARPTGKV